MQSAPLGARGGYSGTRSRHLDLSSKLATFMLRRTPFSNLLQADKTILAFLLLGARNTMVHAKLILADVLEGINLGDVRIPSLRSS